MILQSSKGTKRTRIKRNSIEHKELIRLGYTEITPKPSPAQLAQRKRWRLLGLIHRTIKNIAAIQQQCPDQLTGIERIQLNQAINVLRNSTLLKIREGG